MLLPVGKIDVFDDVDDEFGTVLNEKNLSFSFGKRHSMPNRSVSSLFWTISHTFVTLFNENRAMCL